MTYKIMAHNGMMVVMENGNPINLHGLEYQTKAVDALNESTTLKSQNKELADRVVKLEALLITIADALNGECDRVPNAPTSDVWWYPHAMSETMWERIVNVLNEDPEGLAKRHLQLAKELTDGK